MSCVYRCDCCGYIHDPQEMRGGAIEMQTFKLAHLCASCCRVFDTWLEEKREEWNKKVAEMEEDV